MTMRLTCWIVSAVFTCLLALPTSRAFTMSVQPPNSYRRTSNYLPGSSYSSPPSASRTSNKAVATGCQDFGEQTPSSLRSRVGMALGDIKRRIRRGRAATVEVIEDVSDFDSILKSSKEQFVAVFFHSPVCKACQAAAPHFYKLSQKYSNVKFLSVPLTPGNKQTLQQDLGVKKFPFGHIYHSQHGLLDELPILRKLIPNFEARLQSHVFAGSATASLQEETDEEQSDELVEEECVH